MQNTLADIINLTQYPLNDESFRQHCKQTLDENGALVLADFLSPASVESIQVEGQENQHLAYYTVKKHNIYLTTPDSQYSNNHPRNKEVSTSKGCITTDQIPSQSDLFKLYDSQAFRSFLCAVLGEQALYEYADNLSSVNLHYASEGQELGWHYDNSSFAITLMIQNPESGAVFEYAKDVRDADSGDMNYPLSEKILAGEVAPKTLSMQAGALVLFRGRNSMHRVTPTEGDRTRMLVVLAYNTEPGISLSESARMTFFGRLG
ncbi:2OG-Fe(II) oxygenase [Psychromonas sp. KJ10-10]|uniref:HalD/BesD family halogenase n=1 Tax=Psychromonas sp. KJ10-10 TaxID=3391823 RepID=UPI0039B6A096